MYSVADFVVLWCLFACGFFFGHYCNIILIQHYDTLIWNAVVAALTALTTSIVWTIQKYHNKKYSFNHYYIIFCGLICFLASAFVMMSDNLEMSFNIGFVAFSMIFIASYSFINLRCTSRGLRPTRIGLGNMLFFAGLTTGFIMFTEDNLLRSALSFTYILIALLFQTIVCEMLQHTKVQCYKKSCDHVFNVMNDEKIVFQPNKSIEALYANRSEFYMAKNRQWPVLAIAGVAYLEQMFLYLFVRLTWSATFDIFGDEFTCGPFVMLTIGCAVGTALLQRYEPKFIFLLFGLIKSTAVIGVLGIFNTGLEDCFYFLCIYYISMGVYSSIALQLILECTPFLYTELALSLAVTLQVAFLTILKYDEFDEDSWYLILRIGILSIFLTSICSISVPFLVPRSEGLIEIRNYLLGIRRRSHFHIVHHDTSSNEFTNVRLEGKRVLRQNPHSKNKSHCF